jgi:hypothetical protein
MTTHELVTTYLAAWSEADDAARTPLVTAVWADGARYLDPVFDVSGAEAFDALIGGFHQQYPGMRFTLTGEPEVQGSLVRFTWDLVAGDDSVQAKGSDVAEITADGKLGGVTGFFDQAPDLGQAG